MKRVEDESVDFDERTIHNLYDTALAIKKENHNSSKNKFLFISFDKQDAKVEAAIHIAYILSVLKENVLVINLDSESINQVEKYIHSNAKPNLFGTLEETLFLSEAINHTKYDKLDIIHVESMSEEELIFSLNEKKVPLKISKLKSYYNHIVIIGPRIRDLENYGAYMELTNNVITVIDAKNNDKYQLQNLLQKFKLFNVKSFGILRKK